MRAILPAVFLLMAGCGDAPGGSDSVGGAGDSAPAAAASEAGDERIACAVEGAAELRPVCALEQRQSERGMLLVVHHPGGGFRRLLVTADGRGVAAADGAEPALVTPIGPGEIEVSIGGDRYRLPATVEPGSAAGQSQ